MAAVRSKENAILQLHELLEAINLPTWDSDGDEIAAWLQLVQESLGFWNNNLPPDESPVILHGQEIAFDDTRSRYTTLLSRYNANNTACHRSPHSENQEEFIEKVARWGYVDGVYMDNYLVANHTFYLSSVQPPGNFDMAWEEGWFNGMGLSKEKAQSIHSTELAPFHCTALHAYKGQWWIFDSAYVDDHIAQYKASQISSVYNLVRFNSMLELLRSRVREPSVVYLSGGGNRKEIGESRTLACQWIIGEILHIMGNDKAQIYVPRWQQLKKN